MADRGAVARQGRPRDHPGFHPHRLYFSLVLDDRRFAAAFRANAGRLIDESPDTRELGS